MTKITKKLAETPYTSTEGLEVGRRLRLTQNTVAANSCTPSDTLDTLAKSGWKGDLAAVTALPMAKAVVIPMHTQCLVMEVSSPTCLDVVTVWRERTVRGVKGKLVALCTIRHCSDFILSRGTPRMAGEPEGKAPALTTLPTRLPAMQTIDMTPTWSGLLPVMVHILQHSESESSKRDIADELTKMARAADRWNTHCKEQCAVLEQSAIAAATAPQTASQGGK
jgi:hypothetical protein